MAPVFCRPLQRESSRGSPEAECLDSLPIAIFTDHSEARVWALTVAITWWSLMIVFQSLAKEFWQMICARLGMFFGQSASEAVRPCSLLSLGLLVHTVSELISPDRGLAHLRSRPNPLRPPRRVHPVRWGLRR